MFAKIYGPDNQQILVLKSQDEEGNPQIKIMSSPDDIGVFSVSMSFNDTDEGWDKLDHAFEQMDEVTALHYMSNVLDELLEEDDNEYE